MIHVYRITQYNGSLVVDTPSESLTCPMAQTHPICGCPIQIVAMALRSQFLPRRQIEHLCRQRQHTQDRVRLESSVKFYSRNTVNIRGMSLKDYTSADMTNVAVLGFSYSLERVDGIGSMAWSSTSLFHFVDEVRTPVGNLVDVGANPSSPSTLQIKPIKG